MMNAVLDSKGNEIKVGSLVQAKGSSIVRVALADETGKVQVWQQDYIRAQRKDSHSQDWTFLMLKNVEVIG
jgi:hypothetical protein